MGVGGAGVGLGAGGVGVLDALKREAHADKPKARARIKIRLGRWREIFRVLFKKRGLKNIARIIPMKNPSSSRGRVCFNSIAIILKVG